MKKLLEKFSILSVIFIFLVVACDKEDEEDFLAADDAKVELRAATQDMMITGLGIMDTPAMYSMEFLMQLAGFDDFGPTVKAGLAQIEKYNLASVNQLLRDGSMPLKTTGLELDPESTGVYTFNFQGNYFKLTDETVSHLKLLFPANETAYAQGSNNAELMVSNVDFVEITYTDEWDTWTESILTSITATLKIDGTEAMALDYEGTFSSEGTPTSVTASMTMSPYTFTMTLNGSGRNYTSVLMFKHGNDVLVNYNVNLKYNADMDDVDELSGYIQVTPLKFEGSINFALMNACGETIECINDNVDVTVKHVQMKKILGHLEARMREYDRYSEPEPVIVYEDGTWEFLSDIADLDLGLR